MALKVKIEHREQGVYTVLLTGSLDTVTYPAFEKAVTPLLETATKAVILDMQGVDYISSMGLGAIFKLTQGFKKQGTSLLITQLQPQIEKVFDTVKALPEAIFKNIDEADEYLNDIQRRVKENNPPKSSSS